MKTRYWAVRCGHSFAGGSIDTGLVRSAEATCANLERETPQVASSSSTQQRDADRVRNRHTTRSRSKTAFTNPDPGGGVYRMERGKIGTAN
jgi:hypothetical protein